jgi:hypothetical protein
MNRELELLLHNYRPNDFMYVVTFGTLDAPKFVCKMEASEASKMLLRAAYKFGHLVAV